MKNYRRPGHALRLIAPEGGVTGGTPLLLGALFVIPMTYAAEGEVFTGFIGGGYELPKTAGFSAVTGDVAYWDTITEQVEGIDTPTNRRIGAFADDAAEGSLFCNIRLDGVSIPEGGDLEGKADKVIPAAVGNMAVLNALGNLADGGPVPDPTPLYDDLTAVKALTTQDDEFATGTLILVADYDSMPWFLQWNPTFDLGDYSSQDEGEPAVVIPDDVWDLEEPVGAWVSVNALQGIDPDSIGTEGGVEGDVLTLVEPEGGDLYAAWVAPSGGGGATNLLLTTRKTFTVQHDAGPLTNPLTITLGIVGCTSTETTDGFAQDVSNGDWIGITQATANFQIYMDEGNDTWHYDADTLLGHPTVYVQTGSGRSIPVTYLAGAAGSCVEVHAVIMGMGGIFALRATFDDAAAHNVLTSNKHAFGYLTT